VFLPPDAGPDTIIPVLARMMREMVPVLVSTAHLFTKWVAEHPGAKEGTEEVPRAIGMHEFTREGVTENRAVFPYDLWMLQRPLDFIASLEAGEKLRAADLLSAAGGETFLDFPAFPRVTRKNFKIALA
jgi:hypothetical protein